MRNMRKESTYRAARMVAAIVENHFAQQLAEARQRGDQNLAPAPSAEVIEATIDAAFWASLRREEGYSPKISLAFLPPWQAGQPLLFEQRLPINPDILIKLSPGVERPGTHLGVWSEEDELYIWGTTLHIPDLCFVLDVSEPGLLVVKHRRHHGFGKFTNVAVLIGDQVKVVDKSPASLPDCPDILSTLLDFNSSKDTSVNVLVQLAVSMRGHGHGGSLLIVPAGTHTWGESIIHPIKYTVVPAFTGLANLMRQDVSERSQSLWKASLRQEVDHIAGLTAIDGATVINNQYELLAFGAKIRRREGSSPVERILATEPIVGGGAAIVYPTESGGTRHMSAAQFVYDQRNSLALVASQDGRFTIFTWSSCEGLVQAHRVDTLLL